MNGGAVGFAVFQVVTGKIPAKMQAAAVGLPVNLWCYWLNAGGNRGGRR